jgi:hypothetical protein
MAAATYLDYGMLLGGKSLPSLDAELCYSVASGTVGIIASLIYIIYEVQSFNGKWMELVMWEAEFLIICILYLFFLCRTKTGQTKVWFEGSLVTLCGVMAADIYVARWKHTSEATSLYLLFAGISLCCISLTMVIRCFVRKGVSEEENYHDFAYASSLLTKSRKGVQPKLTLSVSLHPSYEVISSPSEPHLRLRSVLSPNAAVSIDNVFISHDRSLSNAQPTSTSEVDTLKRLKEKKKMTMGGGKITMGGVKVKEQDRSSLMSAHPPTVLLIGALLSLLLLGYLAIIVYKYVALDYLRDLSNEMSDDSDGLTSDWTALKASVAELQATVATLYEKDSLDDSDRAALQSAATSLASSTTSLDTSLRTASSDLSDYSQWVDSTRRSLLLAIRIGAGFAIAVGVSCILLPIQHAHEIRRQMQAGTWKPFSSDPAATKSGSWLGGCVDRDQSLLSVGSTVMGTQLGLTVASFVVLTFIAASLSLVFLVPISRQFLWAYRQYAIVLFVLVLLGAGGVFALHKQLVKTGESRHSENTLLRLSTGLSFFNIVPCQVLGVLRFFALAVCGLCNWGRIDIPLRMDTAYRAFISLLLAEVRSRSMSLPQVN